MRYTIGLLTIMLLVAACAAAPVENTTPPPPPAEDMDHDMEQELPPDVENPEIVEGADDSMGMVDDPDVVFVVTGENFKFMMNGEENPEMRVKQGDIVHIEFESTDGFHDWVLDEFNAATEQVRPDTPTSVTFVANEVGEFEYYCSVGKHRENGMWGNLIVE